MYQTHFHLPWLMSRFMTQCDDTLPSTLEGRITNLVIVVKARKHYLPDTVVGMDRTKINVSSTKIHPWTRTRLGMTFKWD